MLSGSSVHVPLSDTRQSCHLCNIAVEKVLRRLLSLLIPKFTDLGRLWQGYLVYGEG